jgi:hypothetical protein
VSKVLTLAKGLLLVLNRIVFVFPAALKASIGITNKFISPSAQNKISNE